MEHQEIGRWFEGDDCPFCGAEGDSDTFFIETEGGGMHDFVRHNYQCTECEKEWYNESQFLTWAVIK